MSSSSFVTPGAKKKNKNNKDGFKFDKISIHKGLIFSPKHLEDDDAHVSFDTKKIYMADSKWVVREKHIEKFDRSEDQSSCSFIAKCVGYIFHQSHNDASWQDFCQRIQSLSEKHNPECIQSLSEKHNPDCIQSLSEKHNPESAEHFYNFMAQSSKVGLAHQHQEEIFPSNVMSVTKPRGHHNDRDVNFRIQQARARDADHVHQAKRQCLSGNQKRVRFKKKEDDALLEGVEKFGEGKWKDILNEYKDVFHEKRTNVNLKDRYRNLKK
jgi:hypothetical protein